MKVLLIDDTSDNLNVGKQEIGKFFPSVLVETCDNFRDAIGLLIPGQNYDVVLTDLNMPMCETPAFHGNRGRNLKFREGGYVPYGVFIALRAALVGVKYIAIVTDGGHHASAANAALECIGSPLVRGLNYPSFLECSKPHFIVGKISNDEDLKLGFEINGSKLFIIDSFKHEGSISEVPVYGFQGALQRIMVYS